MKKLLAITGAMVLLGSASADAASLYVGVGGPPVYAPPVYAAPAPVYPAPVYAAPAPVYPEYVGGYYHWRPHPRGYDWHYWHH